MTLVPPRFITATALFDGHDAAINVIRRVLQKNGAEVIHLGHHRSVAEIVRAAVDEDVDAIAVSSYQGGHIEFFTYLLDELRAAGATDIAVFAGGGGVIVASEIDELHRRGVTRIYSPQEGMELGLDGMAQDMLSRATRTRATTPIATCSTRAELAQLLSAIERGVVTAADQTLLDQARKPIVVGLTGPGGSGKSSITDELLVRLRLTLGPDTKVGVLAVDPTRRHGGALLGDRIRMNALAHDQFFCRSVATRGSGNELTANIDQMATAFGAAGHELLILETSGIGQGDARILDLADITIYAMTPEYGAASQLEKIEMLASADLVVVNKMDRPGGEDALRAVRRQRDRERVANEHQPDVFGTVAARFADDAMDGLCDALLGLIAKAGGPRSERRLNGVAVSTRRAQLIPTTRSHYLAEISASVRSYHAQTELDMAAVADACALERSATLLETSEAVTSSTLTERAAEARGRVSPETRGALEQWPALAAERSTGPSGPEPRISLSGLEIPRVAVPEFADDADAVRWLRSEHLPGHFPYTAGVFAFKREDEDPTRMFAGEGGPAKTNQRFHLLAAGQPATRLSTAFDSVTLYGADPDQRPDIYGKIGNSGVSIATLDDMADLFAGFDLCSPTTSVSMTINGPAPIILAMYLNVAIDQSVGAFAAEHDRAPNPDELAALRARALEQVRGTVQADILKEDQGQNTCLFTTDFALSMMGDIAEYFAQHRIRRFYSVSISGYHIAEAGANPVTQLAFTLANAFTYVEAYLARGLSIDDFAPNFSFFFSNGMDPEYAVLGRVARRIWAIALRDRYGASERSQQLKYHVQTSGRSLHANEVDFNDIRTTLQALIAISDNCNSLHTNAFDEAVTTPTEASVRRALAIQLIINREWGPAKNENPNQGSFFLSWLTDAVEAAVLEEFDRLSERGGVLAAMERGYQRARIQDESLEYEHQKHDGKIPIVGVNTFLATQGPLPLPQLDLARSTTEEKDSQLQRVHGFHERHANEAPAAMRRLQEAARAGENTFAVLMEAVRHCSLGQLTEALFEVGGKYRRSM
ncbi:MAG: fused isobutyryl-CoA mutase/GTPase IcmF [Acidimicrobiia bacterium]